MEAYANQMEPILDALKYLTPYGFDALTYTILARLTLDRAKVCAAIVCLCMHVRAFNRRELKSLRTVINSDPLAMCHEDIHC